MKIPMERLKEHRSSTETKFTAEAAEIGLAPGAPWPKEVQVEGLGNGQPLVACKRHGDEVMEYRQRWGCIDLIIFND